MWYSKQQSPAAAAALTQRIVESKVRFCETVPLSWIISSQPCGEGPFPHKIRKEEEEERRQQLQPCAAALLLLCIELLCSAVIKARWLDTNRARPFKARAR